jgi:hypothetical protein
MVELVCIVISKCDVGYHDDGICKITAPVMCFLVYNPEYPIKWHSINKIISERLRCPDVAFIDGSKAHRSTTGYCLFHTQFRVCFVLLDKDSIVTVNCRTAIKVLFLYFN